LNQHETALLEAVKEKRMPWYAWLIMLVAIGSIVGGLMMLRQSAQKVDLTEEQLKRVHERNADMDAKDARDR
jgi:cytoskeletal protein RodZ